MHWWLADMSTTIQTSYIYTHINILGDSNWWHRHQPTLDAINSLLYHYYAISMFLFIEERKTYIYTTSTTSLQYTVSLLYKVYVYRNLTSLCCML
jgi:hypothetical protein